MLIRTFKFWLTLLTVFGGAALVSYGQALDTLKIKAEAASLKAQADTLKAAGQTEEALKLYQQVLSNYQKIGDKINQSLVLGNLGIIYYDRRNYEEALSYFEARLTLLQELGDQKGECDALFYLGRTNLRLYKTPLGVNYLLQSLEVARETDDRKAQARALRYLSQSYCEAAKYDSALTLCRQSFEIFQELGDKKYEAELLNGMGNIYKLVGNYAKALDCLEQSLAINKDLNNLKGEYIVNMNIGAILYDLGDYQRGAEIFQETSEASKKLGDLSTSAFAARGLAALYTIYLRDLPKALQSHQEALKIYQELNDQENICRTYTQLGRVYTILRDSVQAIQCIQNGLDIARKISSKRLEAEALYVMSYAYFQSKNNNLAIKLNKEALAVAQESRSADLIIENLYRLGRTYTEQGCDSLALNSYRKCIEMTESIRGQFAHESYKSTWASNVSMLYGDIALILLRSGQLHDAFNYAERGKARSFLDLLASAQVKVGKPEHREFLDKEQNYQEQKQKIEQEIATVGNDTTQVLALRGRLEGDWAATLAVMEETKREEPELTSLVSVNSLTLPEVQKLLDKKTTLLEYFLTEKKTLLWLVTRNQADGFQSDVGGDSLKSLVMAFRQAIENRSPTDSLARVLYDILIAPAVDKIKTENLTIVPHGILHYLPFSALQDGNGRYLLENYRLSYLPSASVLKYLPSKQKGEGETLLALGNPTTARAGYAPIPQTESEVREISKEHHPSWVLTGAEATEAQFKAQAPNYKLLHLSCHGDLNSAYPMYSCLLLAPDSVEDGELAVHEIFNLDLNASLVVLSGCQTGLGYLTNGDELVGLSRAFIYAGAPAIVSSLWRVEDESTAYLMVRFYQYLQDQSKAKALRRAQFETKKKYPRLRSWASFVLTGDGK